MTALHLSVMFDYTKVTPEGISDDIDHALSVADEMVKGLVDANTPADLRHRDAAPR